MVLLLLSLTSLISYLLSLTIVINYLPQAVALLSILFIFFPKKPLATLCLISLIINLIIFSQNGVQSPLFFLIYFLLFIAAFQLPPSTSLSFSLVTTILLLHSTNSLLSLIPIFSLLFITPIVWFISRQSQIKSEDDQIIALEETDFQMWLNLKFKTGITSLLDSVSQLQSSPLTYSQKTHLKKIKDSATSLLHSAQKLSDEI